MLMYQGPVCKKILIIILKVKKAKSLNFLNLLNDI